MKKLAGMLVALIIALGMTGVAYACWSETLVINGTIQTGNLCVGFVNIVSDDSGTTIDPGYTKDVGKCAVWLEDWKCYTTAHGHAYSTAKISITNAYPCYSTTITVTVANCGTIPVDATNISYNLENGNLAPWVEITDYDMTYPGFPQLDPCNTVSGWATIHIKQDAYIKGEWVTCPELGSVNINAVITFTQWNTQ